MRQKILKTCNILLLALFLFSAIFTEPLFAEDSKLRIAILDFKSINTPKTYTAIIREGLEISLHKTGIFTILERNQIDAVMKEFKYQMSGCTDTSCAVQIGRHLSANVVVVGSLTKISRYSISMKFIDVEKGALILADRQLAKDEEELENAVQILAKRIGGTYLAGIKKKKSSISKREKVSDDENDIKEPLPFKFNITTYASYLGPVGRFGDLVQSGFGGMAMFSANYQSIFCGLETGYIYFTGAGGNTDKFTMVPVLVTLGYEFTPGNFLVTPTVSLGGAYNSVTYLPYSATPGASDQVSSSSFEPLMLAGIRSGYRIFESLTISAGFEAGLIIEADESLYMYKINAGVEYRL